MMHVCSYCGIEYDQTEPMCPACGHKTKKIISPLKKDKKEFKEKESKASFKTPDDHKAELKEKDAFYKEALAKLEKSLFKGKKEGPKDTKKKEKELKKEKKGEKKSGKIKEKKKPVYPAGGSIKKIISSLLRPFYASKFSYLVWFFISFFILTLATGYHYAIVGWFGKSALLLLTRDITAQAELLNVHHRINDLNPIQSVFILNGDVHLFIPVFACLIPLVLWQIKKKTKGIRIAGNSNIFTGLILSLASAVLILIILRATSFDYFFYNILLIITLFSPFLDFGILIHLFKPRELRFGTTLIVFLYNIGIPIIFIVISMAFDFISIFI